MLNTVSKSQFKPHALELLRQVEKGKPLIITHAGRPVVRVVPYKDKSDEEVLNELEGSVVSFTNPTGSVGLSDWEVLK